MVTGVSGRRNENLKVRLSHVSQREPHWDVYNCAEVNALARGAKGPLLTSYAFDQKGNVKPPCRNCEQHVSQAAISNDTIINYDQIRTDYR